MSDEALIRMANQIAANFGALPEDEAAAETADHMRRFWEPRMREGLARRIASGQATTLSPVARKAITLAAANSP